MDDFDRELRRSLTTIRDEASELDGRPVWEARAEVLERIRHRRARRFVASGAVAAAAIAVTLYVVARPASIDRADELPVTGSPPVSEGALDYLTPSGVTPVGEEPRDVSVGGRGRIWSANGDATVSQLDETGAELARFDTSSVPGDIAIAGGPVWVALPQEGAVVEVDPVTGPMTPIQVFDGAVDGMELTVGQGILWVVSRGDKLAIVDVADRTVSQVDLAEFPLDVAIHGSSAWVLSVDGSVTPVDQASRTALDPVFSVTPSTSGDLTFADEALWYFTGRDGDLMRLDPDAVEDASTTSYEGVVVDLAIDPQVAWVVLRKDDGSSWLQRIDRATGEPQGAARPIEGTAVEAAIAHGSLWVTLDDRDEVARFPKA